MELCEWVRFIILCSMAKGLQEDSSLLAALVESDQLGPAFKAVFESNKEQEMEMVGSVQRSVVFY